MNTLERYYQRLDRLGIEGEIALPITGRLFDQGLEGMVIRHPELTSLELAKVGAVLGIVDEKQHQAEYSKAVEEINQEFGLDIEGYIRYRLSEADNEPENLT